jgi:hypothetical protein
MKIESRESVLYHGQVPRLGHRSRMLDSCFSAIKVHNEALSDELHLLWQATWPGILPHAGRCRVCMQCLICVKN